MFLYIKTPGTLFLYKYPPPMCFKPNRLFQIEDHVCIGKPFIVFENVVRLCIGKLLVFEKLIV
jgi:hypothetical protein